jgi:peptide/nickel transport system permease protein
MAMNRYIFTLIFRRIGSGLLTLLIVSALVFFITSMLPGDAAQMILGQSATPETVAALRQQLGLDQPLMMRYFSWLAGMLQGDFGTSFASNLPVTQLVAQRIPATFQLAATTTLVSVPLALFIGITAAMKRGSFLDRALVVSTMAVVAVPEFLVATVAVIIFAVKLQWVPAMSLGSTHQDFLGFLRTFALPVMTLCCVVVAQMARMTRAAIVNQMDSPYLEMTLLKGVSPLRAMLRHALPNAVGPIANAISLSLSYLFGGVIIIESIFSYPGLASQMVDAVSNRDLPVVQLCVMFFAVCYLVLLLAADILTIAFNPKWRG